MDIFGDKVYLKLYKILMFFFIDTLICTNYILSKCICNFTTPTYMLIIQFDIALSELVVLLRMFQIATHTQGYIYWLKLN